MARVVKAARCRTLWRSRGSQVDRTPQRLRWMLHGAPIASGGRAKLGRLHRRLRRRQPHGDDPGNPKEKKIHREEKRKARRRPLTLDEQAKQIGHDFSGDYKAEI